MTLVSSVNSEAQHCEVFAQGLQLLKDDSVPQALQSFQHAYQIAPYDDFYHNKYASYYGLARVLNGDKAGVELCRDAASMERFDGDVFLNLACAEWWMHSRKRTVNVLEKGLQIDHEHPGLNKFQQQLGARTKTAISFIPRSSILNIALGKLVRKKVDAIEEWNIQQVL